MDLSTFRPLSIFTWRPSVSDTHRTPHADDQTQNTNTQALTSDENATRSMVPATVTSADPLPLLSSEEPASTTNEEAHPSGT